MTPRNNQSGKSSQCGQIGKPLPLPNLSQICRLQYRRARSTRIRTFTWDLCCRTLPHTRAQNGDNRHDLLAPAPGFEPGTARLTVGSSAVELRRITSTFANTVHTFREQPDEDSNSGSGHRNRPAVTGESHRTPLNPKGCSKRGKRRIDPLANLRAGRVDSGVEHDRPAKVRLPRHSSCHQARTPITIYGHVMLHND